MGELRRRHQPGEQFRRRDRRSTRHEAGTSHCASLATHARPARHTEAMQLLYRESAAHAGPTAGAPDGLGEDDLRELYAWPTDRRWLRANMVASLDGMARGPDGRSGSMSGEADKLVFAMLRQTADAVLVGAGTAAAEDYGPVKVRPAWAGWRREAGQAPSPPIVVVTNRARLDPAARLFNGARGSVCVVVGQAAPDDRVAALRDVADVMVVPTPRVQATALLELLAHRGWLRVLTEGGPTLLGDLLGVVDDLCLTTAPLVVGGSPAARPAPDLLDGRVLAHERDAKLAHVILAEGAMLQRWQLGDDTG
ncbi:MAG: hypothetical protein RLZ55_197 [Actinomycetota bacterium]